MEGAEAAPQLKTNIELAEVLMTARSLYLENRRRGLRGHGRENS